MRCASCFPSCLPEMLALPEPGQVHVQAVWKGWGRKVTLEALGANPKQRLLCDRPPPHFVGLVLTDPLIPSSPPRLTGHAGQPGAAGPALPHPFRLLSDLIVCFFPFLLSVTILGKLVSRIQTARRKAGGYPTHFLPQGRSAAIPPSIPPHPLPPKSSKGDGILGEADSLWSVWLQSL